jgi:hypothetical protein
VNIKLEPGDLEACDAAMRWEKAQEDYASASLAIAQRLAKEGGKYVTDNEAIEQEIQDKGLTAPRVTLAQVEGCIAYEYYITGGEIHEVVTPVIGSAATSLTHNGAGNFACLTVCILVLNNGFIVIGESACASPENLNEELGRKIARQNAVSKIWMLEGYVLKQRLLEQVAKVPQGSAAGGGDFGDS